MRKLVERGIVLEICPSSNLRTHAVADLADLQQRVRRLRAARRAHHHQHRRHLSPRHDAAQGVRPPARRAHRLRLRGARVHPQRARPRASSRADAFVSRRFRGVLPSLAVNQLISFSTRWPRTVVALSLAHRRARRRRHDAPAQRRGPARLPADQRSRRAAVPGRVAPLRRVARRHHRRRGARRRRRLLARVARQDLARHAGHQERARRRSHPVAHVGDRHRRRAPMGAEFNALVAGHPSERRRAAALRKKVLSREFAVGNFVSRDGRVSAHPRLPRRAIGGISSSSRASCASKSRSAPPPSASSAA